MRILVLVALVLSIVSCSWFDREERDEFEGLSTEEQFYRTAQDRLKSRNFRAAIATYQALESRFPFGRYAAQAQLELIYAYFSSMDLEAARVAADRFIRLHPDNSNIDYAYYMKGLSSFAQDASFIDRFLPTDATKRDPGRARESFAEFSQLLALYPGSAYAADARARMVFLRNNLSAYEIHVARYYLKRQAYIAALNRGRYVVENFQGTPSVADGVSIMIEAYLRLGLNDLANTSLSLLSENYPEHDSLDENGNFIIQAEITDPSLLYTLSFGLMGSNRVDAPLAPTTRPINSSVAQIAATPTQKRGIFDIITFGIFN